MPRAARLQLADKLLERAWDRGWAQRPKLDPDALVHAAAIKTGHPLDEDRVGWRERLALLCSDLERVAALTALGRTIAYGQLVAALCHRARATALWRQHPEIAEQPITAPLVVVGQMRSGTTRMQRLLACDPRLVFTRFYESWNPVPRTLAPGWLDDRKLRGWLGLACARLLNPQFNAIHPTSWKAADEEIGLHSVSIFGSAFEAQWRVPNYAAAVEADDASEVYAEFRRLLQTLAWLRRDDGQRPWILKVPQFTQDLAALLQVFPDARLVCVSRNAREVIASSTSLVCNQMAVQSARVDRQWVSREWARKVALREARLSAARAKASVPQVDAAFDDVTRDWQGEMIRIYRALGMTLPHTIMSRMRRYINRCQTGSHVRHQNGWMR